ncbi:MAG: hypothetical protein ACOH5I_06545 [Oligoflexus sp.]
MPYKPLLYLTLLLVSWAEFKGLAASEYPRREEIQDFLKNHGRDNQPLFSGPPLYHVVPSRRNISTGVSIDYLNTQVLGPDYKQHARDSQQRSHHLLLKGYEAAPFISFTTNQFAFAFTAEYGALNSEYLDENPAYYTYQKHQGELQFSGSGVFLSFIPDIRRISKDVIPVFLIGGRRFKAEQIVIGPTYAEADEGIESTYHYQVDKYHLGFSLNFRPLKKISIALWAEHTRVNFGKLDFIESSLYGSSINEDFLMQGPTYETLLLDQKLFWERSPDLSYGVDMALLLGSFEVHLGGALGLISNLAADSPRIIDHGLKVSLSYSFDEK